MPGWMRPSAAPLVDEPRAGRPGWPWDVDDPTIPTTEQDAATAIAAAALLKLARVGPEERRVRYRDFAEVTIEALTARHPTVGGVHTDACLDKRRCMPFYSLTRI